MKKVKLEIVVPANELIYNVPKIKKLRLTERSEIAIFGNLSKHRDSALVVLPWDIDDKRCAEAHIDETQTKVYNKRLEDIYKDFEKYLIVSGNVMVDRNNWDVKLRNI